MTPEEQEAFNLHVRDGYKSPGEKSNLSHLMGKRKINLGCGGAPEPVWNGWLNVDINQRSPAGVIYDMRAGWPFAPQSFDTALAYQLFHVFSFGEEMFHVLAGIWDILKPGGFLVSAVPMGASGFPLQKSIWGERTPHMLVKSAYFQSEVSTTCWDQGLPIKDWVLVGVEKPDLLWFVLQRPVHALQ